MNDKEKSYMLLILTRLKYLKYMRFVVSLNISLFHTAVQVCHKKQKHSTLSYESIN